MFNQSVDKSCQRTNWSDRPLTYQQLVYAALDAYLMTKLFDSLLYTTSLLTETVLPNILLYELCRDCSVKIAAGQRQMLDDIVGNQSDTGVLEGDRLISSYDLQLNSCIIVEKKCVDSLQW